MGSEPFTTYNSDWIFSLTTDWQTYTYTFTMVYSTNTNALLTFNLGISSTDVYLDNISLVEEAEDPEEPEEPEEPAGNMISNWSFSNDLNGWQFNTSESGNAAGKVENGVLHAQITNGGVNVWNVALYKHNLNIINGNTYTVTFDARADSPRNILAAVAMGVSPFWLYNFEPTFSITTEWQTYTYTFTMGFDTDPAARMGFDLGASNADVYLDNISLVDITVTDIELEEPSKIVRTSDLFQNYPNPFNPTTTIGFQVPEPCLISLKIYNLLGKEMATLIHERKASGAYTAEWNAEDFPSGMYIYQLKAGTFTETRKLVLQK